MSPNIEQPWPWWVAGPLIGLFVPALLLVGNRSFGVSSNLRHICAAILPAKSQFFRYDWQSKGSWNLLFAAGILLGGFFSGFGHTHDAVAIAPATRAALAKLGLNNLTGWAPPELFTWHALTTWQGLLVHIGGGICIGFGTAWAGGCTSGHAISGLAHFQKASLLAVLGFFAGGLVATHWLLPVIL